MTKAARSDALLVPHVTATLTTVRRGYRNAGTLGIVRNRGPTTRARRLRPGAAALRPRRLHAAHVAAEWRQRVAGRHGWAAIQRRMRR